MDCIWLSACLVSLIRKKSQSNHAFETNNFVARLTWSSIYLKTYLTRSPPWDEHISFSRVSWPTNRHQVNILITIPVFAQGVKCTLRYAKNGIRPQIYNLQEHDFFLHQVSITVEFPCLHRWHTNSHYSIADGLMNTLIWLWIESKSTKTKISDAMLSRAIYIYL